MDKIQRYVERAAQVRRSHGSVRVAVTPLHGVGGEYLMDALVCAGFTDVHVVDDQFAPDPDFPTVPFPNPEEPGAVDALLKLAADVGADIAVALDPDADRCAVAVPTPDGWRMLSGDETGWLLGDYLLSQLEPGPVKEATVVASTLVSSRMLAAIAAEHGAIHVETLTGFKWLSRADAGLPACTLVYAYEEAIGHCVDPAAVRDKDGISAAVLVCDLAAALEHRRATHCSTRSTTCPPTRCARHHCGVTTGSGCRRGRGGDGAAAVGAPNALAGFDVTVTDLRAEAGPLRTDAMVLSGGDGETTFRVVVRPSGTEPKIKSYIEVRCRDVSDLADARARAQRLQDELAAVAARF